MIDIDIKHLIDLRDAWWSTRNKFPLPPYTNIPYSVRPERTSVARSLIDQIDALYKNRRIRMLLTPGRSRSDDIVLIFSNEGAVSDGLQLSYGTLKEVLLDYYEYKCAKCSISEHDARLRDGRGLELHHISPLCSHDRAFSGGTIIENFQPLCMRCHPRGIYRGLKPPFRI